MEKYIERLKIFAENNDPTSELNRLAQDDEEIKREWESEKNSVKEWRRIKSDRDVIELINCFERAVQYSQPDPQLRIYHKYEMFIAQYKAMRALRKWCQEVSVISVLRTPEFRIPSKIEVEEIIRRLEELINKI